METKRDAAIIKVSGNTVQGAVDTVASELPVTLIVNSKTLVTLLCTPTELKELAVGFLLSEGFIKDKNSIRTLEIDECEATVRIDLVDLPLDFSEKIERRTISSGCGKGITFTGYDTDTGNRIEAQEYLLTLDNIKGLLKKFHTISSLYRETGGVHSAGLSDGKDILFFSEDIGRHNAVDKLIGKAFFRSIPVENKILLTSGRVTSEIVTKAGRNRFPVLISRAAPSCMAVSYAEDRGITLIGFARGERMNIYTWPNRINLET